MFFHPLQLSLWPWHWDAAHASVLIDWTHICHRNATSALAQLLLLTDDRVQQLQRRLLVLSHRLVYRANATRVADDATDVLVHGLLTGRTFPVLASRAAFNMSRAALATTFLGHRVCGEVLCCLKECDPKPVTVNGSLTRNIQQGHTKLDVHTHIDCGIHP